MLKRLVPVVFVALVLVPYAPSPQGTGVRERHTRTIEFETTEVTAANVAVSPDGQWLIFTMLGHLFRLPVDGGDAEQLTFGPFYDTDPAVSPTGSRVAFISNRDGSEGNVFLLDLETREVTQLTHDRWASRPSWSPDGNWVAYLSFVLDSLHSYFPIAAPAVVRRASVSGGESETVSGPPRMLSSVFYLPDGHLGWSAFEGRPPWSPGDGREPIKNATTRIEVLDAAGVVSTLRDCPGIVHRLVSGPTPDGLYGRRLPTPREGGFYPEEEELIFLSLKDGAVEHITPVSGTNGWDWGPRFDVTMDGEFLYVGEAGRLMAIPLPDGSPQPIVFRADVTLEVHEPVVSPKSELAVPGSSAAPRIVVYPTMSNDGDEFFFVAAGKVWAQPLGGGPARVIYESDGYARDPVLSPDGRTLALVDLKAWIRDFNVLDLESGEVRTLASGGDFWQADWHPDGEHIVYVERGRSSIVMLDLSTGETHEVVQGATYLSRPRFSRDGQALWYTSEEVLHRIFLADGTTPEPVIPLVASPATDLLIWTPVGNAVLSPDERWVAFRSGAEIWLASVDTSPPGAHHARRLSPRGGHAFDFERDGSAVVFADANEVWRQPLTTGQPQEVVLQVEVLHRLPPPVLLRHVRLLDFTAGGFGPETSMLLDSGTIRGIGVAAERAVPSTAVILDAAGRFAIPGLFDMHVHGRGGFLTPANLAYGITSVRDMGSSEPWWLNAFDDWSDAGGVPIPRSFHAGAMIFGFPQILATEDDARVAARRDQAVGASLIKVYSTLPWSIHGAVAEEARLLGLPVAAHGTTIKEMTMGVTLGYATLEHAGFRYYDDVLQMLAEAGTYWDPTVGCDVGDQLLLEAKPERVEREEFRAFVPAARVQRELAAGDTAWKARTYPVVYAQQLASIGAAYRRGVRLLAGTDNPEHLSFAGVSLHWELEHLARAGIPGLEVLRIATQQSAVAVGAGADLGTLEPGKFADLILLDANPLEDISNTQSIWRVIKGGWVFDPERLRPPRTGADR